MASAQSGVQLWTCAHAAEVLLELGARVDVVDSLRAAAAQPRGPAVSGDDAARLMKLPLSPVVQMPPTLPPISVSEAWVTAAYALTPEQRGAQPLAGEMQVCGKGC